MLLTSPRTARLIDAPGLGSTSLHYAAAMGEVEDVTALLAAGQAVNGRDAEGRTALMWAVLKEQVPAALALVEAEGCDVDACDAAGRTALMSAAWRGNIEVTEALLASPCCAARFADPNGWTALHVAAKHGHLAIVERVAARLAADDGVTEAKDLVAKDGSTPLMWAAAAGFLDVIRALAATVPDCDVDHSDGEGQTALMWAADGGHGPVVDWLLSATEKPPHTTDATRADARGRTALSFAARRGEANIVAAIVAALKAGTPGKKKTAGGAAKKKKDEAEEGPISLLDAVDMTGATALTCAAEAGHAAVVQILLDAGADPTVADARKRTALHWSAGRGHGAVVDVLALHDRFAAAAQAKDSGDMTPRDLAAACAKTVVAAKLDARLTLDLANDANADSDRLAKRTNTAASAKKNYDNNNAAVPPKKKS